MLTKSAVIALLAALTLIAGARPSRGADTPAYIPFEGERSAWHDGFDRFDYVMDGETMAITPLKRPANEGFGIGGPPAGGGVW